MESRIRFFVAIFVAFTALVCLAVASPVPDNEELTLEDQKILQECRHSDYRTYIACLKRQKRQPHQRDNPLSEIDHSCLETCMQKCEAEDHSSDCQKKCSYCIRRMKHKHQIITEYETECVSGVCNNTSTQENLRPINITTVIDVHNYQGNSSTSSTNPSSDCKPPCIVPVIIAPPPPVLPTVTITFGQSQVGCAYPPCPCPYPWPCYPYPQTPQVPDCSGCGNPITQSRCDIKCYPTSTINNTMPGPCISPFCVGGLQG